MAAFPGTGKIWMNGKLVEWKDATIHIASHVGHCGSGVFEGARRYDTPTGAACFRLDAHMRRLQHSGETDRRAYPLDLAGCMEPPLDVEGQVSEGSGQNVFIVRDNTIYTPSLGSSILGGITRDSIITLARSLGYTVTESVIPREALYLADEVFFVGTAAEVTPVKS